MSTNRRIFLATALTAVLPALTACGDDPTGVGQGTVMASMHDDAAAGQQPAMQAPQTGSSGQAAYSGNASGSAQVEIYSEAQGWVALGAPADVTVELQSSDETTLYASATVPADTYTRVRLVLDGFAAHLDAGAVIGTVSFSAAVDVTMGGADAHVVIEKDVTPFTITASSSTAISFDMNTEVWMDEETAQAEEASDAEVQEATDAETTMF